MNYFNQLLESYNRLKKRTFKLEYICEEVTGASEEAKKLGLVFNPGKIGTGDNAHQGYYVNPKDRKQIYVRSEDKSHLIPYKGNSEEVLPSARATESAAGEEVLSEKYLDPKLKIPYHLKELVTKFKRICEIDADKKNLTSVKNRCDQSAYDFVYGGGNFSKGGIRSLFEAQKLKIDGEDIEIINETSPGLVDLALENLNAVLEYALNPEKKDPEKCKKIKRKMGVVKEGGKTKVVIFGGSTEEGLVVRGSGNYFITLIDQVKKICGDDAFTPIRLGALSDAERNARKGTLHEKLTGFMVNLRNLMTSDDEERKEKIISELVSTLKNAKEVTDYLVKQLGEVNLADFDEHLAQELAIFENELLNDDEKLKTFIKAYYAAMSPFLEMMNADTLVQAGKQNKTGGREDSFFTYRDEESAKKASESVGVRYYEYDAEKFINNSEDPEKVRQQLLDAGFDLSKPLYAIGHGQKLYKSFKTAKIGEFNSITRLFDALLGAILPNDKYFDPEFANEISRRFPINKESKKLINKIRADLDNIYQGMVTGYEFVDSKNNSSQKVSGVGNSIVEFLKEKLGYDYISNNDDSLATALDNYEDNDLHRQEMAQILSVRAMNRKLQDYVDKNPKEGKMLLLRMAFTTGGNAREMVQGIFSEEKKEHLHFSHNKMFDYFKESLDNDTLEVSFTENGFSFSVNGEKLATVKQSGTWRRNKTARYTRTELQVTSRAQKMFSSNGSSEKESDINDNTLIKELLSGQLKLLEEILNQTKKN